MKIRLGPVEWTVPADRDLVMKIRRNGICLSLITRHEARFAFLYIHNHYKRAGKLELFDKGPEWATIAVKPDDHHRLIFPLVTGAPIPPPWEVMEVLAEHLMGMS